MKIIVTGNPTGEEIFPASKMSTADTNVTADLNESRQLYSPSQAETVNLRSVHLSSDKIVLTEVFY